MSWRSYFFVKCATDFVHRHKFGTERTKVREYQKLVRMCKIWRAIRKKIIELAWRLHMHQIYSLL